MALLTLASVIYNFNPLAPASLRLSELQSKGKTADLAEIERYELLALLQVYQLGQLRKSEAIAEFTKRGFPLQQLMTES